MNSHTTSFSLVSIEPYCSRRKLRFVAESDAHPDLCAGPYPNSREMEHQCHAVVLGYPYYRKLDPVHFRDGQWSYEGASAGKRRNVDRSAERWNLSQRRSSAGVPGSSFAFSSNNAIPVKRLVLYAR